MDYLENISEEEKKKLVLAPKKEGFVFDRFFSWRFCGKIDMGVLVGMQWSMAARKKWTLYEK